ncbi:hypothetical protein BLA29_004670, partial [Euroglyphus maynei]
MASNSVDNQSDCSELTLSSAIQHFGHCIEQSKRTDSESTIHDEDSISAISVPNLTDDKCLKKSNGLYKKNNNSGAKRYFAQRFTQNSNPINLNRNTLPQKLMSTTIPSAESNLSLGCSTSGFSSSTSSMSPDDNHRYLTYGTSAQLQQEYGKFLPWPTLTEFRLRRKLRRFKRRARKLFNGNNLLGKSFNQIQNVKRLIKMAKQNDGKNSDNNNDGDVQVTISRSSSLTSLLNLIEEANKNLLNSFHEEDMLRNQSFNNRQFMQTKTTTLNQPPPKCPPRLKRAMSSINVGGQQQLKTQQQPIDDNQSLSKMEKQKTLPIMERYPIDSYRIAFVENKNSNKQQQPQQVKNSSNTDLQDTISVKSLDSYFGSISLNDNHQQQDSINQQQQQQRNSKILCVRSHFQINNGTIYLEDSDWEMCSEISEPSLSLNESINNSNDMNLDTDLIDLAL